MESILYFYPNPASFVKKDLQILESKYKVNKFQFVQTAAHLTVFSFIKQFVCLLRNFNTNKIVIQFGGYHSFLPCLFGLFLNKKTILILAGTDCACFPEINYGNYRKRWLGYFTKKSIEWAKIVVPVHKALIDYPYTYFDSKIKRQGFKNFIGKLRGSIEVAEYGFELNEAINLTERKLGFITIAGFNRENIFYLKGLDLICKIAPFYPDLPFYVIGASGKYVNFPVPDNVKILPFIKEKVKIALLNQYTFYLQLSISEGFPNALCEAMQNGMIAIVSDVSSMPDIVSSAGFVLKHKDTDELKHLIDGIFTMNLKELAFKNSNKINTNYTPERRKQRLLEILEL
jgi:glycosyltransferase involved in cell wall biosynthesis